MALSECKSVLNIRKKEEKIFLNSDTFHFLPIFVCGSWDCLMEEKLTTHFNFLESKFLQMDLNFSEILLYFYIYPHDKQ